jgi:hypothetical protein
LQGKSGTFISYIAIHDVRLHGEYTRHEGSFEAEENSSKLGVDGEGEPKVEGTRRNMRGNCLKIPFFCITWNDLPLLGIPMDTM